MTLDTHSATSTRLAFYNTTVLQLQQLHATLFCSYWSKLSKRHSFTWLKMGLQTVLVVPVVHEQMSTGGDNVVCSSETTSDSDVTPSEGKPTDNATDVVVIGSEVLPAVASADSFNG